jgi:UDP-glucose 4-epimerase
MKVLITGGAGFIGSHLVEKQLSLGNEVYVIDDLSTGSFRNLQNIPEQKDLHLIIDSVLNPAVVEEYVRICDEVYHLAAAVGVKLVIEQPTRTIETNITGTQTVLKACARYHKRALITSTSEVYGKGLSERFREGDDCVIGPPSKRRWSYAASKAMEEYLAFAYYYEKELPVTVVRLFNTIGPRQTGRYGMVVPTFITQALKNVPLTVYGDGMQTRSFICVHDAVEILAALMNERAAVGEVFNIGARKEISINDLAHLIIRLTGSTSAVTHLAYLEAYGEEFDDMKRRVPDTAKVETLTGISPRMSLEETLRLMIEYYGSA